MRLFVNRASHVHQLLSIVAFVVFIETGRLYYVNAALLLHVKHIRNRAILDTQKEKPKKIRMFWRFVAPVV